MNYVDYYPQNNTISYRPRSLSNASSYYPNPMQNTQSEYTRADTLSSQSNQSNQSSLSSFLKQNYYKTYNILSNNTTKKRHYSRHKNSRSKSKCSKRKKIKKKVKFNESVDVIIVESYKKYNKDDEISIGDYFDKNYNFKPKNEKKNGTKCECKII